jgi:hypothetical protein
MTTLPTSSVPAEPSFTRAQVLAIAAEIPLELLDPTRGSGDSDTSRKFRRADFMLWLGQRLSGWESQDK